MSLSWNVQPQYLACYWLVIEDSHKGFLVPYDKEISNPSRSIVVHSIIGSTTDHDLPLCRYYIHHIVFCHNHMSHVTTRWSVLHTIIIVVPLYLSHVTIVSQVTTRWSVLHTTIIVVPLCLLQWSVLHTTIIVVPLCLSHVTIVSQVTTQWSVLYKSIIVVPLCLLQWSVLHTTIIVVPMW